MKLRIAVFSLVFAAIAGAVGVRAAFSGDDEPQPIATASKRAATEAQVAMLEQRVEDGAQDAEALTQLGSLYLTRARETGDPSYYALADEAVKRSLAVDPNDASALVVAAALALARHDFAGALALGDRARALNPDLVAVYGVLTDAHVELGHYDEAIAAAQEMIDRRPDFASYSRASYIRELHGDLDGAIGAMLQAADAGSGIAYDEAWARVIVGNLYLTKGDLDAAERSYEQAASVLPGDALTLAGLARIAIASGDLAEAEGLLRSAVERRPLPEYTILFGDLLSSQGRTDEAERQYALVRAAQQLFAANGGDADIELAQFDADHGTDPQATYEQALAAYGRRPSVYAADTVAWAAYKAGDIDEAARYLGLATRLGTRDARLAYHAGVIADAAGDRDAAIAFLRDARAMEFGQSLFYVSDARQALARVEAEVSR